MLVKVPQHLMQTNVEKSPGFGLFSLSLSLWDLNCFCGIHSPTFWMRPASTTSRPR